MATSSLQASDTTAAEDRHVLDLQRGELVRVRGASEILRTLDDKSALEGLPFMPEMLSYCGQTLTVDKRAGKTCTPELGLGMRRMSNTVHLANVRCDGAAHGGCQAACLVYWKEAWLERVTPDAAPVREPDAQDEAFAAEVLLPATKNSAAPDGEDRWRCQATDVGVASTPLRGWEIDQYATDARNWGLTPVLRMLVIEAFSRPFNRLQGHSRRLPRALRFRDGQTYPFTAGPLAKGQTPSRSLDLQPGDRVRIRSKEEILQTLDATGQNRGLRFDGEMVKYCGRTATVRARVRRLINERTGKMFEISSDCIMLEGVTCTADYHQLCPRGIFPYWREIWLERAP